MATPTESLPLTQGAITISIYPASADIYTLECSILQILTYFKINPAVTKILSYFMQPTLENIMYIVCELVDLGASTVEDKTVDAASSVTKCSAAVDLAQVVCAWCSGQDVDVSITNPGTNTAAVYNVTGITTPIMDMETGVRICGLINAAAVSEKLISMISGIVAGKNITTAIQKAASTVVTDMSDTRCCFPCFNRKK